MIERYVTPAELKRLLSSLLVVAIFKNENNRDRPAVAEPRSPCDMLVACNGARSHASHGTRRHDP